MQKIHIWKRLYWFKPWPLVGIQVSSVRRAVIYNILLVVASLVAVWLILLR